MNDEGKHSNNRRVLSHKEAVALALSDSAARAASSHNSLVIQRRRLYAESATGVLADLADVGFPGLDEVRELRQLGRKYEAAVPVLLDWLPRARYLLLADDITRTLSVAFAKQLAMPEFLRFFRQPPFVEDPLRPQTSEPPAEHLRWVFGNGLGIFAGPAAADELIELALDRSFGTARTQIVSALPKTKDGRVPTVLLSLLDDPTVSAFAVEALGKMRFTAARERIVDLLGNPDKNIRDQAGKALKRLGEE